MSIPQYLIDVGYYHMRLPKSYLPYIFEYSEETILIVDDKAILTNYNTSSKKYIIKFNVTNTCGSNVILLSFKLLKYIRL